MENFPSSSDSKSFFNNPDGLGGLFSIVLTATILTVFEIVFFYVIIAPDIENIMNGHAWWNQKSDFFNWEKVTDWSTHKPKRQLASSWADKHIIIDLLKKIYNKTNFNNE